MVFHGPRSVHLTHQQARSLLRGGTVGVKHSHVDHPSGCPVFLTQTQHKRMTAAKHKGAGVRLRFSKAQISHHVRHGGGFWSSVWDGLKNVGNKVVDAGKWAYNAAKPVLKPLAKQALSYAADKVGDLVASRVPLLGAAAKYGLDQVNNYAQDKIDGAGIGHKRKGKKHGAGLVLPGSGLVLPGHGHNGGFLPPPVKGTAASMLG